EGDLGPERDRAHHLAAGLVRRQAERWAAFDRDEEVGAERRGDVALGLPLQRGDGVLRTLGRALEIFLGEAPFAHPRLDRRVLAVCLTVLAHGVDGRETVG